MVKRMKQALAPAAGILVAFIVFRIFLVSPLPIGLPVLIAAIIALLMVEKRGTLDRMALAFREHRKSTVPFLILLAVLIPILIPNAYLIHLCVLVCMYSVINIGLDFQLGMTNMVNFATAAFFGVGAYTTALLTTQWQVSLWAGILLGGLNAGIFGFLLGIPTLRTRDYYLSLVTLAFQFIFVMFIENMEWTGGPDGVRGISLLSIGDYSFNDPLVILGLDLPYQANFYYLVLILLLMAILASTRLRNSRVGLAWNAIRADEVSAGCQGINLANWKLAAFSIGAFFAGVIGAVYTHYVGFISPNNFGFNLSVALVCMLILGGMDNVAGIIIGTIILTILPEKLREFSEYRMVIYGVVVVVMLIFRPQGLLPKKLRNYGRTGDPLPGFPRR